MLSPPPATAVDTQDASGKLGPPSPAWRTFFVAVWKLLSASTQSGTTAQRPTQGLFVGRTFFDTDVQKTVVWDGTNWVFVDPVLGPVGVVDGNVALFDGTTGKLVKDGGTLGTAAFSETTDYATAAQGAKADSAVQPASSPTFATVATSGYTVATLPAGTIGMRAYVTNALAPAWGAALVGGGAVKVPAFYNGTTWIAA